MRKWITRAFLIIFISPVLTFGLWYGLLFNPYTSQIEELAVYGNTAAQPVMPRLRQYAVAAETESGIRAHASRQAYWHFVFGNKRTSTLWRHVHSVLWHVASYINFDDEEILGVWVACSVSTCGAGLPEASKKHYGKELAQLNQHELLGLVTMVKGPSVFMPGSERSEKHIEFILRNLSNHVKNGAH